MRHVVRFRVPVVICLMLIPWMLGPAAAAAGPARTAGVRLGPGPLPPAPAGLVEGEIAPADMPLGSVPSMHRSTEGLVIETLPGGWRRVNLQGRFRAFSVVTIAADGALHMACADDPAHALALATQAPTRHVPRPLIGPREE